MTVRPVRLIAAFFTVGVWTMASRVLGFVRDVLIAAVLGTGPVAEAFFVAFTLPNMFRRLFAEGAFNTAFVPLYAKRLEGEGPDAARRFSDEALSALAAVLFVLTLVAHLAMPALVWFLASGFAEDRRFAMAELLGRIIFPYILFISLAALVSGLLNAHGRFAAAAAAPVLLNVILIAALLLAESDVLRGQLIPGAAIAGELGAHHGTILAWAVLVAGAAQLALVWRAAAQIGMAPRLCRPRLTPGIRRLAIIAFPAALAAGVMQVNLVVGRQVASYFDGAVAWLWLADRVYQLPLGVIGVAVGVVLLPELARQVRAGDTEGSAAAVNRAAEFALVFTLPATVALITMPALIVEVLFERGAFGPEDTAATALALAVYVLGLPAYVLQKIVQPLFFAREDTRTPLRFALVGMAVNAVVALGLAPVIGFLAAALGSTVAAWVNLVLLWRGARRAGASVSIDPMLRRRFPRMALAALVMGAGLLAAGQPVAVDAVGPIPLLCLLVIGGLVGYAGCALAFGAVSPGEIKRALRRRGAA
ncbi:MAG: murein biosynthesis integral membrane protein MurJ [Pseudomonadota bacterium]